MGQALNDSDSSLFVSRDAGRTWTFAGRGDFSHNILDQGGVIVAVNYSDGNSHANDIL